MTKVSKEYFHNFGYTKFGPFLLEFSRWLYYNVKKLDIKKVFFLARDGFIFKQAFDMINEGDVSTTYMYASRRSICVPALHKAKSLNNVLEIIKLPREFTIGDFLNKIGVEEKKISKDLSQIGIKCDDVLINDNLKSNKTINLLYDKIKRNIDDNSLEEYKNLMNYLETIGFSGNVAIVDIGWYGSMQKSLKELKPDAKIFGFYVGINAISTFDNEYNGFLYDGINKSNVELINSFRQLFEYITLANHGSVKRFNGDKSIVDLYENEYSGKSLETVKEIQSSALTYIKSKSEEYKFDLDVFCKLFLKPKLRDTSFWGNIPFYDNQVNYMANPKSFSHYILHPKEMLSDYKKSGWKIGFMKRLFKIPFPYYKLNIVLRKKYAVKEK